MIVCYTVPEMWHVTGVIVMFHFGLFSALLPPPRLSPRLPKTLKSKKKIEKNY